ncbi:MAG TPA: PEGA domain-containing protein [Bryobacteraceae bacterium]|nr:PEGA domain-containing protein [Bryobacteraceae bacterium]
MIRRYLLISILAVSAAFADKPRVRLGGVVVGANYSSRPAWYGPGPWGYGPGIYRPWWGLYDPFWTSSYIHPALYGGFYTGPNMGEIKLDAPKDASVYLDGAFAGVANKLKTISLEPGIYELNVKGTSGEGYRKKVYVLSGKTLNIRAEVKP